jgi:hypothetical protein
MRLSMPHRQPSPWAEGTTRALRYGYRSVIVAVTSVLVVQMRSDDVVDVIAVRHLLMSACGVVRVFLGMLVAGVRIAAVRLTSGYRERVLVYVITMRVMEVTVVDVVVVIVVPDFRMTAARAVLMGVFGMRFVCHGL